MSNHSSLVSSLARGACALLVAAGALVTGLALRDSVTHSAQVTRDLGVFGWALFGLVTLGVVVQGFAAFALVRGRAGRLRDLRSGFVLVVAVAAAHMTLVRTGTGISVELFLAAWASAFAWVVLRSPRRDGTRPSRLSLIAFQVSVALVTLELALRTLGTLVPTPLLVPADSSVLERIEAHSVQPGFVHLGFPHNSAGFYDEEFLPKVQRERTTVAVVGDSFSLSVVPHRAHYTTECERVLGNVDLYNVGVGACGPEEYRELLVTDVLPLEPDAVVIALFVGNDLGDLRTHMPSKVLRSWFDRGSSRTVLLASRMFRIARERMRGGATWAHTSGTPLETEAELRAAYPWYDDPLRDEPALSEPAYLELVRSRIPVACRPTQRRLRALFDVLMSMRALARKPFGVLLIPAEYQVEDALWRQALAGLPDDDYARDEPQRSIARELKQAGVPFVDLLPSMRAAPPLADGDRHLYRPRDTHWGVLGNRLAGQQLASLIRRLVE